MTAVTSAARYDVAQPTQKSRFEHVASAVNACDPMILISGPPAMLPAAPSAVTSPKKLATCPGCSAHSLIAKIYS